MSWVGSQSAVIVEFVTRLECHSFICCPARYLAWGKGTVKISFNGVNLKSALMHAVSDSA